MTSAWSSSGITFEPSAIERFLRSRGWTELTRDPGRSAVFGKAGYELRVPLDPTFADYDVRVRDVIQVLETTEGKSTAELMAELSDPDADVVVFRLGSADIGPGTIDARDGLVAITRSMELFVAAAASAVTRRPTHRWSVRDEDVVDYLAGVRLGPSEPGSYTIRFLVSSRRDAPRAGLGRSLTTTLARSLQALTDPLIRDDRETLLDAGVSAELCFALSDLVERPRPIEVEITFDWSGLRVRDLNLNLPSVYRVGPQSVTHLRSVGEELGGYPYYSLLAPRDLERALGVGDAASGARKLDELPPPRPGVVVAGPVLALYGRGRVHIRAEVDGRLRTVRVELSDADYVKAIHAHERGWKVRVIGDLLDRSRIPILFNAGDFMVIGA